MIDLHIHLDGSLGKEEILRLAEITGTDLSDAVFDDSPPSPEGGLKDYLKRFELPLSVLQSPESVYYAIMLLAERLKGEGLEYAEIRFAPSLHTRGGHRETEIVSAASDAAKEALCRGFPIGVVLCCMRGLSREKNLATASLAADFVTRRSGIVGLDLAGDEGTYPNSLYGYYFGFAKEKGIPFTVHAGEACGAESVLSALRQGAKRIGHGIRAAYDEKTVSEMLAAGVTAELCYTSNLQTGAWSAAKEYPLRYFMERGVKVTLNTDNTAVSKTSLKREYELLRVTPEEERILDANARAAAFENRLLE